MLGKRRKRDESLNGHHNGIVIVTTSWHSREDTTARLNGHHNGIVIVTNNLNEPILVAFNRAALPTLLYLYFPGCAEGIFAGRLFDNGDILYIAPDIEHMLGIN